MKLTKYIEEATKKLVAEGFATAGLDVKLIVTDQFNFEMHELITNEDLIITHEKKSILDNKIKRRLNGEPVSYILGYKYFYKSKFNVNSDVLIPRPETELLVEEALKWANNKTHLNILDLGAGSGCLGQSVLNELKSCSLTSIDISEKATLVAQQNAKELGLTNKIEFYTEDIKSLSTDIFIEQFDLILANPPYIDPKEGFVEKNVKKYEPDIALFSEENGLRDIITWTEKVSSWLKPSGLYLMEFGDEQASQIKNLFQQKNYFVDLSIHKDYSGLPRYLKAIK